MSRIPHPRHERNLTHPTLFMLLLTRKLGQQILYLCDRYYFFFHQASRIIPSFFNISALDPWGLAEPAGVLTHSFSCVRSPQWCLVDLNVCSLLHPLYNSWVLQRSLDAVLRSGLSPHPTASLAIPNLPRHRPSPQPIFGLWGKRPTIFKLI